MRGGSCLAFAFLWERACSRRRPDSRPVSYRCTHSNCRSEPARDGGLPTYPFLAGGTQFQCGSEPAREGGLTADLFFADVLGSTVGASLLAMAVCQPTNFLLAALNSNVGASLLAKAACLAKRIPACPPSLIPTQNRQPYPPGPADSLALVGVSAIKNEWSGLPWSVGSRELLFHSSRVVL